MSELPTGTLTFLFSDIEGSTKLVQELGETYYRILERHAVLIRDSVAAHGGNEIATEGDSFFVVFGDPTAAVAAAVDAQKALGAEDWPGGVDLRVRMGLHTGQAELGGDNYVGIDVHRAARIAAAGHGGQVVVSDATRGLVEKSLPPGVELEDLGDHRLKDLDRSEHLWQLVIEGLPSEFPVLRSLDSRPTNLKPPLTSFIGRGSELEQIRLGLLGDCRLMTLTGPGGTGKTRLGIQAGHDLLENFSDGVFFVPLAPVEDSDLVAPSIAGALGVGEEASRPLIETLTRYLEKKELLLVVDNFEQVMDAASLISHLLDETTDLRFLATSREPLKIQGEREFPVDPLPTPDLASLGDAEALSAFDAVTLFVRRAWEARPGFELTDENAAAIAEICSRLDGLPLAIELAAARTRALTPDALLSRMGSTLGVLKSGSRDAPERQKTLRGAIEWSYELLDQAERDLFVRLAVFVGGWTLQAAEAVCDPNGELDINILDGVESLVDKSLVRYEQIGPDPRYRFLQVIREYALGPFDQHPSSGQIRAAHAEHFKGFAAEAGQKLMGSEQTTWLARIDAEADNLRAALRWAVDNDAAEVGLTIGGWLFRYWQLRGSFNEGRAWLEEVLALPSAAERTWARAKGLDSHAGLAYWQTDYALAQEEWTEALEIYRQIGDQQGVAWCHHSLGYDIGAQGNLESAVEHLAKAEELWSEISDGVSLAYSRETRAFLLAVLGKPQEGLDLLESIRGTFVDAGDKWGQANIHTGFGRCYMELGRFEESFSEYMVGMGLFIELGDLSGVAFTLEYLGEQAVRTDRYELAVRMRGAADAIKDAIGGGAPAPLLGLSDPRESAKGHLGDEEIAEAYAKGRAIPSSGAKGLAAEVKP